MNSQNRLWKRYHKDAQARGELVMHLLKNVIEIDNSRIVDIGCGTGDIARLLAGRGARVLGLDPYHHKQQADDAGLNVSFESSAIETASLKTNYYDAALLIDVIEHVKNPQKTIDAVYRCLKPNGYIYLSTPNRFSFLNILCDPHYSLPLVALLKRKQLQLLLSSWLSITEPEKPDHAELFSLWNLGHLLRDKGLKWRFVNQEVAEFAQNQPRAVWNRNSHLKIVKILNTFQIYSQLINVVNNAKGIFNRFINPTWFIVAKKIPS